MAEVRTQFEEAMRDIDNAKEALKKAGGNEKLATSGVVRRAGGFGFGGALPDIGAKASIVSHQNVLNRMSDPDAKMAPEAAWPTETYFDEFHKLSEYVNGEAVILYHA